MILLQIRDNYENDEIREELIKKLRLTSKFFFLIFKMM